MISNLEVPPFLVASYCGDSKPKSVTEYLDSFIQDINNLLSRGISFRNIEYSVLVKELICDAPARAYIKCIKTHTGHDQLIKLVRFRNKPLQPVNNKLLERGKNTNKQRTKSNDHCRHYNMHIFVKNNRDSYVLLKNNTLFCAKTANANESSLEGTLTLSIYIVNIYYTLPNLGGMAKSWNVALWTTQRAVDYVPPSWADQDLTVYKWLLKKPSLSRISTNKFNNKLWSINDAEKYIARGEKCSDLDTDEAVSDSASISSKRSARYTSDEADTPVNRWKCSRPKFTPLS
ncbi:hypothetical protein ILUMI_16742, partial [Ignelater luminosus]